MVFHPLMSAQRNREIELFNPAEYYRDSRKLPKEDRHLRVVSQIAPGPESQHQTRLQIEKCNRSALELGANYAGRFQPQPRLYVSYRRLPAAAYRLAACRILWRRDRAKDFKMN
jgi:hypothetical protein